jgi:hypothetical protein
MITVSAFKWVPESARGQVRDLRVRWALEEAGLPYKTRLLEQGPALSRWQPLYRRRSDDDDGAANPQSHGHRHERQASRGVYRALHLPARLQARARRAAGGFQSRGMTGKRIAVGVLTAAALRPRAQRIMMRSRCKQHRVRRLCTPEYGAG